MPVTSLEHRQIKLTKQISCADNRHAQAVIYLKELMKKIGEPYHFVVQGKPIPRVEVEAIGSKYMTINYVRAEDETVIPKLVAASKRQGILL